MGDVRAQMKHIVPGMRVRPRYHANDSSRDVLELEAVEAPIADGRVMAVPPSLDAEGFALVRHESAVPDFHDAAAVAAAYPSEIAALVKQLSGADEVVVTSPGILRFGEKSADSGQYDNSRPARFLHVDVNDETAAIFAERSKPEGWGKARRFAHYNIWRVISPPPQDVPLALCDARSVTTADLTEADAVFDAPGKPEWSFTGLILKHNPAHRWIWFSDMDRDEAIMFKTNDSDPAQPHCVPHGAFDNPDCPDGVEPRASIEIRAVAYWRD